MAITHHDREPEALIPGFVERSPEEGIIVPASIGQQVFTLSSGLASALAGLVLANRIKKARAMHMKPLMLASLLSSAVTFGAVFLITYVVMESAEEEQP